MADNPLGLSIASPDGYDATVLYPIARQPARSRLGVNGEVPWYGFDHWHAYELSWLNPRGKPQVAVAELFFVADSENMVESKSLKLYLNSLHQHRFGDRVEMGALIQEDLSRLSKSEVRVLLREVDDLPSGAQDGSWGRTIDHHDITTDRYQPDRELLAVMDEAVSEERIYSHLFRSVCPVTGAPDWASVRIGYTGQRMKEEALLRYLCAFRRHQGYHEECAERIYLDLMQQCRPESLCLSMHFLRRGGLDINVYRSSLPIRLEETLPRHVRQ